MLAPLSQVVVLGLPDLSRVISLLARSRRAQVEFFLIDGQLMVEADRSPSFATRADIIACKETIMAMLSDPPAAIQSMVRHAMKLCARDYRGNFQLIREDLMRLGAAAEDALVQQDLIGGAESCAAFLDALKTREES